MSDDKTANRSTLNPARIAEQGEKLYAERHKARLEAEHPGKFVAVDVVTGDAYIGVFPEAALDEARKLAPNGVFHLIRIGSEGAYRVSHLLHGALAG